MPLVRWLTSAALALSAGLAPPGATGAPSLYDGPPGPRPWGFPGHRTVCEIAWLELTEAARSQVRHLTEAWGEFDTFAESCVWADSNGARGMRNAHWVNLPPGSDAVTMDHCPADCVLRHLAAEMELLGDASSSEGTRARALMFVGHFVGDIHAPLHVAYGADRGGNEHEIRGLGERYDDLHAVWDSYILRDQAGRWQAFARELHGDIEPIDRTLWADLDPLVWANESYRIVEDYVYEDLAGEDRTQLGDGYDVRNRRTAVLQLKKAGVRLAALLSEVLG
jgi:hypothetical protein